MSETRCEQCDLIIGLGCDCGSRRAAPRPVRPPSLSPRATAAPGTATIIVSPAGNAHLPDCPHLSDSEICDPKFGWVTDAPPDQWRLISEERPLRATHGNTNRVATRICDTCSEYL